MAPRIVVVGSTMIDLIAYADRLPDDGETVVGTSYVTGFGGKGANQAVMAARFGAEVAMVNTVGDDTHGTAYLEKLGLRRHRYDVHASRAGLLGRGPDLGRWQRDEPHHRGARSERAGTRRGGRRSRRDVPAERGHRSVRDPAKDDRGGVRGGSPDRRDDRAQPRAGRSGLARACRRHRLARAERAGVRPDRR